MVRKRQITEKEKEVILTSLGMYRRLADFFPENDEKMVLAGFLRDELQTASKVFTLTEYVEAEAHKKGDS